MTSTNCFPVFISATRPCNRAQEAYLAAVIDTVLAKGMTPVSFTRNENLGKLPLVEIRDVMRTCAGTIVLAMARTMVLRGVEYVGDQNQRYFSDRVLATDWTQIEAVIALQLGHPILVLKEDSIHPSGVLDPAQSGLRISSVSLGPNALDSSVARLTWQLAEFKKRVRSSANLRPDHVGTQGSREFGA